MPQNCKICNHPQREDINADIISTRLSLRAISQKYDGISYSGVRWHKKHHLGDIMEKVQKERVEVTKGQYLETLDALNMVINQLPEVLESASLNTVLRALEQRSKILGEEVQPPRIIIEWGLPYDREYFARIIQQGNKYKALPGIGDTLDAEFTTIPDPDEAGPE